MHLLTGEAVPLAPFAADAALGIATLAMVLVFLVCLGLREGWDHTIGHGLRWIAHEIDDFTLNLGWFGTYHVFSFVADVFIGVDRVISHALAVAALNSENACSWLWHTTGRVFWWSVHETKALAIDTYHLFRHTVVVTIPNAARWSRREAVDAARRLVHRAEAEARAAEAELGHLAHVAEADATHALAAAEHALGWAETEVGVLGRDLDALRARVGRIARQLSPAAIVALIGATIFNDLGLGWLRCGQVGRLGRAVCGMPTRLLDDLLELFAGAVLFTSLCEVMPLLSTAVDEVGTGLVEALHATGLAVCGDRYPPAPAMPAVALALPATATVEISLAP